MKTYKFVPVVAGMLLAAMFTVGCNSEADQLRALNRRANDETAKALGDLAASRAQCQVLQTELDKANAALAAKDTQIGLLNKKIAELEALVAELRKGMGNNTPMAPDRPSALPDTLSSALSDWANKHSDLVTFDPLTGMVKFKSDMTFASGSDIVNDKAKAALAEFVKILNMPDASNFNIYVAGHTDDVPILKPETKKIHPNNWYLSVHRAVAVEDVMEKAGLAGERAGAMGFGEYHPIAPNAAGHKGNEVNRRVEIWIVPPDRFLTVEGTISEAPKAAPKAAPKVAPKTAAPKAAPAKPAAPEKAAGE